MILDYRIFFFYSMPNRHYGLKSVEHNCDIIIFYKIVEERAHLIVMCMLEAQEQELTGIEIN